MSHLSCRLMRCKFSLLRYVELHLIKYFLMILGSNLSCNALNFYINLKKYFNDNT